MTINLAHLKAQSFIELNLHISLEVIRSLINSLSMESSYFVVVRNVMVTKDDEMLRVELKMVGGAGEGADGSPGRTEKLTIKP